MRNPGYVAVIALIRRCAWCSRVLTERGWEHGEADAEHETSTICPVCADRLRALGQSR